MTDYQIKDVYKKAEEKVLNEQNLRQRRIDRVNESTAYAIIHYKNHENWYKLKVNHLTSSSRLDNIVDRIKDEFPLANTDKIRFTVSKSGVYSLKSFILISSIFHSLILASIFYNKKFFNIYEDLNVFFYIIPFLFLWFISIAVYDCSSFIRLYRLKK